jgi:hypothetical protein
MRYILALLMLFASPSFAGELISSHAEREDLGGGKKRLTISSAPIAYQEAGQWKSIVRDWQSGDAEFPSIVTAAKLKTYTTDGGMRRICPTGDPNKWIAIGSVHVQNAQNAWVAVPWSGGVRSGNRITWTRAEAIMTVTHGGHWIKKEIELLGGYVPRNSRFGYPVGIQGLTRNGTNILDNGVVVAVLSPPVVYDAANPQDVRPITSQFVSLDGTPAILHTLPSLTGMIRPVVDPTVTLQPEASEGKDARIVQSAPTINAGAYTLVNLGHSGVADLNYRPMLQFDLSSIPRSATVKSSVLTLYRVSNSGTQEYTYGAYKILRAWTEGTGTPGVTSNGATWNTYNGVTAWGTAGCNNTTTDRSATPENPHAINYAGDNTWSIPLMTQEWVRSPSTNNGLIILTEDAWVAQGYWSAGASDNATASLRPKLTVEYTDDVGGSMLFH